MSYTELENNYNKIQKFYLGDEYQTRVSTSVLFHKNDKNSL
jgi:hypothetical protein